MNVDIGLLKEILVDPECFRLRAHVGERGLGGFFHNIAKLAREGQLFIPRHL